MLQAKKARIAATVHVKVVKSRVDFLKATCEKLQAKADWAESVVTKTRAVVAEAEKQCSALKSSGHEVPEDGDSSSWRYSASTAWHPDGILAAKARFDAK